MPSDTNSDRRLSEFGQTWVRGTHRETGPTGSVGWYLWAGIALVMVLAAVVQATA